MVLEGCSDKETAFLNWMGRDILFAQEVRKQCHKENYVSVINDGNMDLDELASLVATHFGFSSLDTYISREKIKEIKACVIFIFAESLG